jgi:hypothetical protein
MKALLALTTTPIIRVRALAVARHRGTGAIVRFPVVCAVVADPFVKGEFGKVYQDSQGSYRWVTLHPHGEDEPGTPVKIRESKTEPGTWHVVAGAGGKLNYLRLTGVKSPEEHRRRAEEKRKARKEARETKTQVKLERRKELSEDERKAEAEKERARQEALETSRTEIRTRRQEFVAGIAQALGWKDEEWKFDDRRQRLEAAGAGERIAKIEEWHHKRVYQKARDALAATKRQLLADPEQARALLGTLPISTEDAEKVGLTDVLEAEKTPSGKGYQSATRGSSDREIRAAVAAADIERLREDVETATAAAAAAGQDGSEIPDLKEIRGDLHMAELLQQAATMTPEQIEARRKEVDQAITGVKAEQQSYLTEIGEKRTAFRETGATEIPAALQALEERAVRDAQRLEQLRQEAVDVAVIAGESVAPAIGGEKGATQIRKRQQREQDIAREHGEEAADVYRLMLDRLDRAREHYQAEMRHLREVGALPPVQLPAQPVTDAQKALELLAHDKAIRKMERQLTQAEGDDEQEIDERLFGKGYFTGTGKPTERMLAEAKRSLEGDVTERLTRAFLERSESPELLLGRGGTFRENYDRVALHRALERHFSAGAYNAVNNAALAALKTSALPREVVDVLGAAGAAQLLAHRIRGLEGGAVAKEMAESLGEYHVRKNVQQAEERVRELEEALDRADEALGSLSNPSDVTVAVAANRQRAAALEEARQTIGQALGEYETTAALVQALREGPREEIHANLGPIGTETAIRQLRALGLGRHDYEITSDGANYFATIAKSGFDKLVAPVDRERMQLVDDVIAIKRGEQDDPNWRPKGTVSRPRTTFDREGIEPPSLTAGLKPYAEVRTAGDVEEHIARRAANGENLNTILTDLHAHILEVPAAERSAVLAAVDHVFPLMEPLTENGKPVYVRDRAGKVRLGEDGKPIQAMRPVKAEAHEQRVGELVRKHLAATGTPDTAAIQGQEIALDDPKTHEAVFRALARDPRAMVAFTPPGEITDQDQRALRHYFATEIAKVDPKTGVNQAAIDAQVAALGPEPPKAAPGLFGEATTPEWLDWNRQRQAIVAGAHFDTGGAPKTTAWDEYVAAMGGTAKAYQALQDRLKSGFLQEFHRGYTTLHNAPLRVGIRDVAHAELHAGYLDPAERARLLTQRRKLLDDARTRLRGQYATGSALEKMERIVQAEEIARQNQMGLLGATREATGHREPTASQRYTLGARAEAQLASLMPNVAKHFRPGQPVKLLADKQWAGDYIHQQRAVKTFLRTKRMAAALGTGSGKTSIAIGAFAHARETPGSGVKRGLFLVPSSIQGQFGGEFARFADPQKMTWAANPGGDRSQRLGEHGNPDVHAVVHTHQGFRDDMLHLLGQHWGTGENAAKEKFMALPRKDAAAVMREVWKKNGIDYHMLVVDEGHGLLDRQGKPDSLLSRIVQSASDNAPYYMSASVAGDTSLLLSDNGKIERLSIAELADRVGVGPNEVKSGLQDLWVRCFDFGEGMMTWGRVTAVHKYNATAKRCFEIRGAYNKRLVITEDHSMYVWRDGRIECVRGDDVRMTDQLVLETKIDMRHPPRDTVDLFDYLRGSKAIIYGDFPEITAYRCQAKYRYRKRGKHGPYLPLDAFYAKGCDRARATRIASIRDDSWCEPTVALQSLGYLIGLYIGDGCLDANTIQLTMHSREVDGVMAEIQKIGGMRLRLSKRKKKSGDAWDIRVQCYPLARLFRYWFGGKNAHTKRIPSEVLSAPDAVKREVLRGYVDSDGHVRPSGQITITSCNRALLEDAGVLLGCLGVMWAIDSQPRRKPRDNRFDNGGPSYALRFTPEIAERSDSRRRQNQAMRAALTSQTQSDVARRFGVSQSFVSQVARGVECGGEGKGTRLWRLSPTAARVPIVALREVREEWVYDISVDGAANFIANGTLTHNSADPVKNDVSELRSLLDKLDPSGRYSDSGDWQRRYGVNTTAAAEALKREVAPYIYAATIPSGNVVRRRREVVNLHPEQERQHAAVLSAFERLRAARGRGEADVEAARVLAPERFASVTEPAELERVAREVQRNGGAARDQALARVIETAPRQQNAKIQKLMEMLKTHPVKDAPVVVFAHRLEAVREITEALAEAGHRVESLTGADSAQERDRKRLRFQPETGDAQADVFVLSDAGEAGLNLQRGQTVIQYDRPMTAKTHAQRNGRIDRLGQKHPEIDLIDLTTDTPYEARAQQRIEQKYALREILTDPAATIDDEGLAGAFNEARRRAMAESRRAA